MNKKELSFSTKLSINESEKIDQKDTITFSHESGFYRNSIKVEINSESDDSDRNILYTSDGSIPTQLSNKYIHPIQLEKNTVIRAREIYSDETMGPVSTHFFGIGSQPSLPYISITADPDQLWSDEEGILALGKDANPNPPYNGANFWNDWEIPIHLQWFETRSKSTFEAEAAMELFGGESRLQPQKSLALSAKKKYGVNRFEYPFFPELPIRSYKSLILRNSGQDFPRTHFLDGMIATVLKDTDLEVQAYRPVVVFLNGQYSGVYDLREKISTDFLADHHESKKSKIDLLESDGVVKAGDDKSFKELITYIRKHDLSDKENYQYVEDLIDIKSFIDYFIAEIYIANQDWPDHNIRYWRSQEEGGRWRWIVYDTDQSFRDPSYNSLEKAVTGMSVHYPSNQILIELLKQPIFKKLFLQRFAERMKTTFEPEQVIKVINNIKSLLEPEMEYHLERWGGSVERWKNEIKIVEEFARLRPAIMRSHIQKWFKLTDKEMQSYGY